MLTRIHMDVYKHVYIYICKFISNFTRLWDIGDTCVFYSCKYICHVEKVWNVCMPFSGWWLEHTTRNRVFCRWNNVIMSTKSPRGSWILVTCVVLHDITAVVTDYWQRNVGHQAQGPSNWGWQTSNSLKFGDGFEGPGVCATFYVLAWSLRGRSGREVSWLITKWYQM